MHAKHWQIADGQLAAGETFHAGHQEKDDADREALVLDRRYQACVRKLKTVESDAPIESPQYEAFPSARWCVIVKE